MMERVASGVNVRAESVEEDEHTEHQFVFTGNAGEYFRIWIVNTLLTIVTFGIYSAWAKVRNTQYFYRNTTVAGSSFEYLAKPLPILKGRILAALVLAAVFATQHYSTTLYLVLVLGLVVASPWVLVKSLAFNARNSSFRNIRLAFTGQVGEAMALQAGLLLLYVFTCGLAYPYVQWRLTKFVVHRHLYGDLPFAFEAKAKAYYKVYLMALLLGLPGYALLLAVLVPSVGSGGKPEFGPGVVIAMLLFYAYLLIPVAYLKVALTNLLYAGTYVGPHRFQSTQRTWALLRLYVVNALGVLASAGLLIPWAKIRLARYRASTLALMAVGGIQAEKLLDDETSAMGEGFSDLGDFDIGVGT